MLCMLQFFEAQTSEENIHFALTTAGARSGAIRQDHFHELELDDEGKEIEKVKDTTQTLAIASVLIATVTFGATFALPGGYRADDHNNGGTPTLAGRYTFDAFMIANALAFISSAIATIGLMRSGSPLFKPQSRKFYLGIVFHFMETSVTCLFAAFALGVYMVLAPVAQKTALQNREVPSQNNRSPPRLARRAAVAPPSKEQATDASPRWRSRSSPAAGFPSSASPPGAHSLLNPPIAKEQGGQRHLISSPRQSELR
nr:unnamed protein product [Digitaria exilis]